MIVPKTLNRAFKECLEQEKTWFKADSLISAEPAFYSKKFKQDYTSSVLTDESDEETEVEEIP